MAVGAADGLGHRRRYTLHQVAAVAVPEIPCLHGEHPALRRHHRATAAGTAEDRRDRSGVERGAHHDDPQVGPERFSESDEQPEDQIHLQRPLVELVQNDSPDPLNDHVADEAAKHDPGRFDDEPGVTAHARLEPHPVADFTTRFAAAEMRDLPGDRPGREPPRLQQDDLRVRRQVIEDGCGHEHRLARPGRRGHDHGAGP